MKRTLVLLSVILTTTLCIAQTPADIKPAKQANYETIANNYLKEHDYFGVASGMVGGAYFVLGELIAGVISRPKYSLPCGKGGSCGVDNLVGLNTPTSGSVMNLDLISQRKLDSGFAQSNMLYWAYSGTGVFDGQEKRSDLRAIASLYTEYMHVIVRKAANIHKLSDLVGKNVALGTKGSGTLYDAQALLSTVGITNEQFTPLYLSNTEAITKLKSGEVDAVFAVVGVPAPFLSELMSDEDEDAKNKYAVLSLSPDIIEKVLGKALYYLEGEIPEKTYQGQSGKVNTYAVRAVWVTHKDTPKSLVYKLTEALWAKDSRLALDTNATGRKIMVNNSLEGIGIPLHSGAKQYYNKIGKRF